MVDQSTLSSVLGELALTLATDFPITGILDHLVERIVTVLPVTAAGVTLIGPGSGPGSGPRYVAASDESARLFERLQSELGQGPCVLAYETGEAVTSPDIATDTRFPEFGPAATAAGLAAVFTFPLHHQDGRFGALDLYRDTVGELGEDDLAAAQVLANVAAAYLLNAQSREDAIASTARLRHLAMHDPLTGLPNRLLLQDRIEQASRRSQRSGAHAALVFVDLDRFKLVNDNHGHQTGDELLREVARRLTRVVRPGDTLARLYGDEFVLLCEDLADLIDVQVLTDRIQQAMLPPFVAGDSHLRITASVGVAFAGPGEYVSERLIAEADSAMYDAKRGGAGSKIVDLRDAVQHRETGRMSRDLAAACAGDDLHVAYQPLVRCEDGLLCGVEALVRWHHPEHGPVPATTIIAIAERSGLMSRVGRWVLVRACRDAARWRDDHPSSPVDLAVNVSAHQLMAPGFVEDTMAVVGASGLDPRALVLEVTENILIEDGEVALLVLQQLRRTGIRIALDDFGTGYSSLSYLHRLPLDILKIDQSFVADIERASRGGAIVGAITTLAHVLDLLVVAEGVETPRQGEQVREMGADQAQGYLYARPMSADSFDDLLRGASPHLAGPLPGAPGDGQTA
ncbi:MAG: EAL domain-containing protein [Nocardioidaceae bacterium]